MSVALILGMNKLDTHARRTEFKRKRTGSVLTFQQTLLHFTDG